MFDIGNEGADEFQVFDILFRKEFVVKVKADTVCVFLKKELSMFIPILNRIELQESQYVILA